MEGHHIGRWASGGLSRGLQAVGASQSWLVATLMDSWLLGTTVGLVMAATLLGCWHWHLWAIVTWDTWLVVMAATLLECWHWHQGATLRESWLGLGVTVWDC